MYVISITINWSTLHWALGILQNKISERIVPLINFIQIDIGKNKISITAAIFHVVQLWDNCSMELLSFYPEQLKTMNIPEDC